MSPLSRLFGVTLTIGILSFFGSPLFAAQNQFTVHVPKRADPTTVDQYPILKLKVTIYVDTAAPVTFSIQDPWGDTPVSIGPLQPVHPVVPSALTFFTAPAGRDATSVRIYPPDSLLGPNDPNNGKYVLLFDLNSDFALGVSCTGKMVADEEWTISVAPGPHIGRACAQSLNRSPDTSCSMNSLHTVPLTGSVAQINGLPNSALGCRPGVDTILVLDKSGSMGDPDLNPMGAQPKINALHTSVKTLVTAWDTLRTNESSMSGIPQIVSPNDQIGVVLFDTNVSWWTVGALGAGLNPFDNVKTDIINNVDNINPGTRTAIGKALLLADPMFPAAPDVNRHVVLLMTDGIQNEDPMVGVNDPMNPTQILTYAKANPNNTTPVPNQSNYQVYVTSVGVSTAVDPTVIQPLATAGRGYYRNTETDSAQLNTFFTETLQNFLQFSTQETTRILAGTVVPGKPFKPAKGFPITTTSQSAIFSLTWDPNQTATLQLTVTPPGGGAPIVKSAQGGLLLLTVLLPPPAPYDPNGDWNIQIDAQNAIFVAPAGAAASTQPGIPFNLLVMADDVGVNSTLSVVPADYAPADPIKLQVKLSEFGEAMKNATVVATLVKPGKSIGDLLSESSASSTPSASDPDTPANAKLQNALKANPSLLVRNTDIVTLFDDGKPEHGDAVAGDGIYSALYPAQLPGHYNFLFAAEGASKNSGKFSRMQLQTVFVRSVPDAGDTQFQTSVSGNTMTIVMTPRTKAHDHMGPGWANYFWFTSPGVTPFKAKDNLNGTYTATLTFTGGTPPPVTVHFLRISMIIDDSVTPDNLPVPLDSGNVFVDNCCGPKVGKNWAAFLDLGANIPHGTFSNGFNTGISLNAGLEYMFTNRLSAEGIFGYHNFPAKIGSNLNIFQFSADLKAYLLPGTLRPFVNGGIGGYKLDPGSAQFGGNFGAGVLKEFTPQWGFQGSYNFHVVNTPGTATKFSTLQAGIRYVF